EIARFLDGVFRDGVPAERGAVGRADGFVPQGLVGDAGSGTEGLHQLVGDLRNRSALEPRDHGDLATLLRLHECAELVGPDLLGRIPRPGLAVHGAPAEAVGMIDTLEGGVTGDAECARVHRMIGVALELDDAALAVLGEDAAAGWALAAYRREVRGDTGDDVLGRRNVGIQLFRGRSASR